MGPPPLTKSVLGSHSPGQPGGPLGVRNWYILFRLVPKTPPRETASSAPHWKVPFKGTRGKKTYLSNRQVNKFECAHIISSNTPVTYFF